MKHRPISTSIVCYYLIITSFFSAIAVTIILMSPEKIAALKLQMQTANYMLIYFLFHSIANIILAACMLRGINWARHLFLILNAILYIAELILSDQKIIVIIAIIIFLIILYFLYNEKAQQFFAD